MASTEVQQVHRRKQGLKAPTRRSMTFSGCFTCRARGVKCDEQQPACLRCTKAKRECAGYGVRLIWEEERQENSKTPQDQKTLKAQKDQKDQKDQKGYKARWSGVRSERRSLPWAYGHREDSSLAETPPLGDDELDALLAVLADEQGTGSCSRRGRLRVHPHSRLFTVFPATSAATAAAASTSPGTSDSGNDASGSQGRCLDTIDDLNETPDESLDGLHCLDDISNTNTLDSLFRCAEPALALRTSPHKPLHAAPGDALAAARLCPSPQASKESWLLDYWVSHTAAMMIAIPRIDNPFQTIFVPMVLAAQSELFPSPERTALLHGICAMAAFNCAQQGLVPDLSAYNRLGAVHHQASMAHLRRSFAVGQALDPEVVLATILIHITTNCISSNSIAWRTHISLGRQWIKASENAPWLRQRSASTLRQIFLILEAVGTSANKPGLHDTAAVIDYGDDYAYNRILGLSCPGLYPDYQLDSLFGLTPPMFEAMVYINRLGSGPTPPSQLDIDNVRAKILLNEPRALFADPAPTADDDFQRRFVRHHAYVYYLACRIHFERLLCRTPPRAIQDLVRSAFNHLEAISGLERNVTVVGLLWPVLVIASEATDPDLQEGVGWYFEKGKKFGIGIISSAHHVLTEVWRRRRACQLEEDEAHVSWQGVMHDLGLDLLLT